MFGMLTLLVAALALLAIAQALVTPFNEMHCLITDKPNSEGKEERNEL